MFVYQSGKLEQIDIDMIIKEMIQHEDNIIDTAESVRRARQPKQANKHPAAEQEHKT